MQRPPGLDFASCNFSRPLCSLFSYSLTAAHFNSSFSFYRFS